MRSNVKEELKRAMKLHPVWPEDQVHQVAIVCEESGEALKAALNYQDHGKEFYEIYVEMTHTAAMCERWFRANEETKPVSFSKGYMKYGNRQDARIDDIIERGLERPE